MRIVIRPSMAPQRELDITQAVIGAVAAELYHQFGGNDVVNWLEAERQVARLLSPEKPAPGRIAGLGEPQPGGQGRRRTTTLHPPAAEIEAPAEEVAAAAESDD
ncbi:MAG: hypothetical protein WD749_04265 [Phycisphaerales bacterium]